MAGREEGLIAYMQNMHACYVVHFAVLYCVLYANKGRATTMGRLPILRLGLTMIPHFEKLFA